ncbi:MAG TPA: DeoR/GlpR transcriptional regulator [Pseudoclavibacter sp.]|nr:DeoR/GlpR transcriptional regulator [Pseudoclavibacter sp.]
MYAPERHIAILELARRAGRVDVATLAQDLAVTPETIRRDLTTLERRGTLHRVHGGAIPVERLPEELRVSERIHRNSPDKLNIAVATAELLPPSGTLFIDAGTTTALLASHLPEAEYTIVTHSLTIAQLLADRPGITLVTIGGRIRERTLAAVGAVTLAQIHDLRVDYGILGINGITPEFGLSTPDPEEAAVKDAIIGSARHVLVMADHSKFGVEDLAHVAPLSDIDTIITDRSVDPDRAAQVRTAGPEVVLA